MVVMDEFSRFVATRYLPDKTAATAEEVWKDLWVVLMETRKPLFWMMVESGPACVEPMREMSDTSSSVQLHVGSQ